MLRTTASALMSAFFGPALVLLVAGGCAESATLSQPAATWSDLPGTDDKNHSLADYAEAKAVVMVFTCNDCPVAKAYEDRLIALQKDFGPKGVQLIAVNVNKGTADRLPAMKQRAEEKKFNFPYLFDESQKIARDYGAAKTPHVFLLSGQRKVVYMGAVDDNMDAEKAEKHYLREALDAVLAGRDPDPAETKAVGCSIKFEKKNAENKKKE